MKAELMFIHIKTGKVCYELIPSTLSDKQISKYVGEMERKGFAYILGQRIEKGGVQ